MKDGKNYWIRSGAYAILQRMGGFIFGFGSYFFLVRYFDVDSFGVWTLFIVLTTSLEMARSAFIQNAFVKFYNEAGVDKEDLFTSSLILNFLATILLIGILLLLSPILQSFWNSEIIGLLIFCYSITAIILVPLTQLNYLEQANHHFSGVFWSTMVRQGIFFVIVIACNYFHPGLPLVFFALAQSLAALLGLSAALILTKDMLPNHYLINWATVNRLFKFGKYIFGTGLTSTIGRNADQIILGGINHSMVAIYSAGLRVLNFIEIPSLAISNIVYPKIAERASKSGPHSAALLYEKSVSTIVALILPIVLLVFLFPKLVLFLTAGEKYIEASSTLRIMVIGTIFIPFNIQIGSLLEVINRPQISFYFNVASTLVNLVLNIFLITAYGTIGAALSYVITILAIFLVGQVYLNRQLSVKIHRILFGIILVYKKMFLSFLGLLR